MEGLVLPVTAFMSFASILWLVVAKLATSGNEDEASSSTASANNDDDHHVAVTVSSSGNIISAKTITSKKVFLASPDLPLKIRIVAVCTYVLRNCSRISL